MQLNDRHVVITGGSRGLGAAMGRAFTAAGAAVTLVARSEDQLKERAAEIGADYLVADLREPDGLISRIERAMPIDILVNNAGIDAIGPLSAMTAHDMRDLFAVNALAPAELTRQVVPGMIDRGRGRIVFVSSLSAQVAMPGLTAYSATKAATSQFAEGLRSELRGTPVGVTTVEVGPIATEMYDAINRYPPGRDAFGRMVRLGFLRVLSAEKLAAAVVKACRSDRGSVVLPRRARSQVMAARFPQRVADRVLASIRAQEHS
jgi:short-subunit dehydrogenase